MIHNIDSNSFRLKRLLGCFNKTFSLKLGNGSELINEVAMMKFARTVLGLPVLRVLKLMGSHSHAWQQRHTQGFSRRPKDRIKTEHDRVTEMTESVHMTKMPRVQHHAI